MLRISNFVPLFGWGCASVGLWKQATPVKRQKYLNNLLNLPQQVKQGNAVKATYTYIADGAKVGVISDNNEGFDYLGSIVYKCENNARSLESTSFGGGRINATNNTYEINYFVTDHIGSIRAIVNQSGQIIEQKDYYPFGMEHQNGMLASSTNRYRFSGKEKQEDFGISYSDFHARQYDSRGVIFTTIDPLAEKRYHSSPYDYCSNSPITRIDPDGMLDDGYIVDDMGYFNKVNNEGGEEYDVVYREEAYSEENRKNYDESGGKDGLKISKGVIQSDKPLNIINEKGKVTGVSNLYTIKSDKEATKIFEFMAKHTKVEWSNTLMRDSKGKEFNLLMTSHSEGTIIGGYHRETHFARRNHAIIIRNDHNHPDGNPNPSGWSGDIGHGWELQRLQPNDNILFRVHARGKYKKYEIPEKRP